MLSLWCSAHIMLAFFIDASYVIGITYQRIDKDLISELLGGLQGMFHLNNIDI